MAGGGQAAPAAAYPQLLSSDVFPIGVWLQQPRHARQYKDLGINLYVGLWKGPTPGQLAILKRAGMPVICEQNEVGLSDPNREIIVGWQQVDEPDNAQPLVGKIGLGGWGSPIPPSEMLRRYQAIRTQDPSRPVFMNLGKGVAWDAWKGRGKRTGHPEDYAEYAKAADILSFDIYPAAETDAALAGRLDVVAQGVKRLLGWAGPGKTVWNVVGASRVKNPNARVDPDRIRAQVWMSIISGSRGIIYFVHQFKPRFVEASWFEDPQLAAAMNKINARVQSLARVINSPPTNDIVEVSVFANDRKSRADDIAITSRQDGCSTYVFAASLVNTPLKASVRIKGTAAITSIEVLDEARSIPIDGGRFMDDFPPYGVHLYKTPYSKACSA